MSPLIDHDDDAPVGKILTRREMLSLLAGLGGAALLAACDPGGSTPAQPTAATTSTTSTGAASPTTPAQTVASPGGTPLNEEAATAVASTPAPQTPTADAAALPDCVVKPDLTEGPYFVDVKLDRSDIRPDTSTGAVSAGVPLTLAWVVSQVASNACTPLPGALVDVWHCDAEGVYSGVRGSAGTNFLRGYQTTDAAGKATFTTIFPGWYRGRAVHIHFKIRTAANGSQYEFTSQLFFDEALTGLVYAQAPYSGKGLPDTPNSADNIYRGGGDQLLLKLAEANGGYTTTFNIALDMSGAASGARAIASA